MPPLSITQIVCLLIVTTAAVYDLRTSKIPNALTAPAALLGIAIQFMHWGPPGALSGLEGWLVAASVMLATRAFGWPFGMGDVKLVAAIGSFVGPSFIFIVFFYFFLSLGPVSCWRLLSAAPWRQMLRAIPLIITTRDLSHFTGLDWRRFNTARQSPLLFGPFYAIGTACAFLLEQPTRAFFGLK